jgi:hypothetical protein
MKTFNKWWIKNGQLAGFIFLIVYLNGFWFTFQSEFQNNEYYPMAWLIQFFGLAVWYSWQSRKHGWRLPKDVKDTHSW